MAYKYYDSRYNDRGYARERVHAANSWNTYDGDNPSERTSQRRYWEGGGQRGGERRGGTMNRRSNGGYRSSGGGRFEEHRSTQDFQNRNAINYNRGREGDQQWRQSDYGHEEYLAEHPAEGYGERYGFSG